jgi:hypothetical protein
MDMRGKFESTAIFTDRIEHSNCLKPCESAKGLLSITARNRLQRLNGALRIATNSYWSGKDCAARICEPCSTNCDERLKFVMTSRTMQDICECERRINRIWRGQCDQRTKPIDRRGTSPEAVIDYSANQRNIWRIVAKPKSAVRRIISDSQSPNTKRSPRTSVPCSDVSWIFSCHFLGDSQYFTECATREQCIQIRCRRTSAH